MLCHYLKVTIFYIPTYEERRHELKLVTKKYISIVQLKASESDRPIKNYTCADFKSH